MKGGIVESIKEIGKIRELVTVEEPFKEYENDILSIIGSSGALLEGHFSLLNSGCHSNYFLRFSKIASYTEKLTFIAEKICEKIYDSVMDRGGIDAVVGPETAGSALVREIARILNSRDYRYQRNVAAVIAKTDENKKPISLINNMDIKKGDRVLIVNDILTTGRGIEELIKLTNKYDSDIIGIVLFSRRNNDERKHSLEEKLSQRLFYSMTKLNVETYKTDECKKSQDDIVYSKDLN